MCVPEAAPDSTTEIRFVMMVLASIDSEALLLKVILQLIVIIAFARIGGWIFKKLGQPQVVGEIAAGLLLGPSCFGRLSPTISAQVFSDDTGQIFLVLGQLGLVFLMFIVGLEFDFGHLRTIGRTAGTVALAGIALPFAMGACLAYFIHDSVAAEYSKPGFILFMATALSITAIPILGRIMMEFGITRTPLGVLTISAAAVDDAVGWILLAAVSAAVRGSFSLLPVLQMLGWTALFIAAVFFVVRPIVCRWSQRILNSNNGELPLVPFSIVLLLVLTSAVVTNGIGIFSIFGPFVLGASLCDQKALQTAIRLRLEQFVTAFFLPVFFTYTGLRTNIGTLDSAMLWIVCGLVITVATVGKVVGCGVAARLGGMSWRDSASVAIMMNTRALMGLIAVSIGRDLGAIPDTIFCVMVIMSIVTTLITAPILRRLQPISS
jgi:Kef-type K+ transport system membrane component KefB